MPEVLITTRSPSSKKRGNSEKCECTSAPSDFVATSIRTASRVMPRYSGGAGASSSGGNENVSGLSSGRRRVSTPPNVGSASCGAMGVVTALMQPRRS